MMQIPIVLACLSLSAEISDDVPALEDLFAVMQENAALYDNIETRYSRHVVSPQLGTDRDRSNTMRWRKETYHAVWQGTLYYCKYRTDFELYDGSKKGFDTEYGYDNKFTRINYQGTLGNIDDQRQSTNAFFPPHHLGMPELGEHELSEFLQLAPSVKADRRLSHISRIVSTVDGTAMVAGVKCIKIKADAFIGDEKKPRSRYLFWIAPDKNYLVVRAENYLVWASLEVPISEYETSDWRELAAGVWLPFRCSAKQPRVLADQDPKEWEVESTTTYVVEFATLNPKHPIELFRSVEMPKDVPVYILKGGEIVETTVNGQVVPQKASRLVE